MSCRSLLTLIIKAISGLQRALVFKGVRGQALPGVRVYFYADLTAQLHFLPH